MNMALDNWYTCYDDGHFVLPPPPPEMDWNFWELELHALVGGNVVAQDGIQEGAIPAMLGVPSPEEEEEEEESSEASSGGYYLQDAVARWGDRCKRPRRVPEAEAAPRRPGEATNEDLHCLLQRFWDSGGDGGDLFHDLNIMIPECGGSFVSGEDNASGWEREREQEQGQGGQSAAASAAAAVQQVSAEQSGGEAGPLPSSASSARAATTGQAAAPPLQPQKATSAGAAHAAAQPGRRGNNSSSCAEEAGHVVAEQQRLQPSSSSRAASASPRSSLTGKEKRDTGVLYLYPFAAVKPLGLEGGGAATLDDVNQRILKRPARPVRHPVGQFACSPAVYAHGLGLSGKAVVSLTRIRTAGRGTITIIRTRG
ncbi:hypothetical protein GUJ93_ZPchr0002g25633 [Zizania palustris]|uniref:Protein XRI1 n=1 Tax=Zizania palustris TaxID=103762 RepID=A0A8J5V4Q5_ZIZPA|nr:hypothetical protein GUJ93_ZPchr0002g25633 [Zizania palustris]